MRLRLLLGLAVAACSSPPEAQPTAELQQPVIGGRPSPDDENAAVYLQTRADENGALRCSGRIVAPGLVLTARHCLLKRATKNVVCYPDGSPSDVSLDDVRPEPPEVIHVEIGSTLPRRVVAVKEVVTELSATVCKGDIAFVVLAEPGLDVRTPLRRKTPERNERVTISGWGFTDDTQRTKLPETRGTIDATISDVGPGFIPAGTFAIDGATLCLGDSGAVALIDGAVVGTYSRIDDPATCTQKNNRNILTMVAPETNLVKRAYAAIGEEPYFAGEQKPWLAAAGAACAKDDVCRGGVCEGSACKAGCGPTGLACASTQQCGVDGLTCEARPVDAGTVLAAPPADESCAMSSRKTGYSPATAAVIVFGLLVARRRRTTGTWPSSRLESWSILRARSR